MSKSLNKKAFCRAAMGGGGPQSKLLHKAYSVQHDKWWSPRYGWLVLQILCVFHEEKPVHCGLGELDLCLGFPHHPWRDVLFMNSFRAGRLTLTCSQLLMPWLWNIAGESFTYPPAFSLDLYIAKQFYFKRKRERAAFHNQPPKLWDTIYCALHGYWDIFESAFLTYIDIANRLR